MQKIFDSANNNKQSWRWWSGWWCQIFFVFEFVCFFKSPKCVPMGLLISSTLIAFYKKQQKSKTEKLGSSTSAIKLYISFTCTDAQIPGVPQECIPKHACVCACMRMCVRVCEEATAKSSSLNSSCNCCWIYLWNILLHCTAQLCSRSSMQLWKVHL